MGKHRFYCIECNRFLDRRGVTGYYDEEVETTYYCRKCGSRVIKVRKVFEAVIVRELARIIKAGAQEEFE